MWVVKNQRSDLLEGSDMDEKLEGKDGDDVLSGGNGDDTLVGGIGEDFSRWKWRRRYSCL